MNCPICYGPTNVNVLLTDVYRRTTDGDVIERRSVHVACLPQEFTRAQTERANTIEKQSASSASLTALPDGSWYVFIRSLLHGYQSVEMLEQQRATVNLNATFFKRERAEAYMRGCGFPVWESYEVKE